MNILLAKNEQIEASYKVFQSKKKHYPCYIFITSKRIILDNQMYTDSISRSKVELCRDDVEYIKSDVKRKRKFLILFSLMSITLLALLIGIMGIIFENFIFGASGLVFYFIFLLLFLINLFPKYQAYIIIKGKEEIIYLNSKRKPVEVGPDFLRMQDEIGKLLLIKKQF